MKNVRVYSEKATHDSFHDRAIVVRKLGLLCGWEHSLVRKLLVNPIHEQIDVLRGRDLDGGFVTVVCPEVLVFRRSAHNRAGLRSALVAHGAVDEVDLVEKVNDIDADPVVHIVAVRDLDSLAQVSCVERGLENLVREFVDLVPRVGGLRLAARLERLVAVEDREHGDSAARSTMQRQRVRAHDSERDRASSVIRRRSLPRADGGD